jgi:molybdate transport system substrate-binding protein
MRRFVPSVLVGLTLSLLAHAGNAAPPRLLVFAAASLTDVLKELSADWTRRSGMPVELSFAASSVLARQIEAGGSADVFISADQPWMDYLAERRLIEPSSRRDLIGNVLVLVAPADSEVRAVLRRGMNIDALLGGGRLATGDPDSVPVGRYARAAFESLGLWDQVRSRLVPTDNVRGALNFVARGEVPLAVVYATDARVEKAVRIVATFPATTHPPITYPGARTAAARPEASGYLAYLAGPDAATIWNKHGFRELSR